MTTRRKRPLSEEDKTLWKHVTSDVTPLARMRRKAQPSPQEKPASRAVETQPAMVVASPCKPPQTREKAKLDQAPPPALVGLDRRERKKLASGKRSIEARVDLHGLKQAQAHALLRGFLAQAHSRGERLVLVITGKGRPDGAAPLGEERGVLRRVVPRWLGLADLRSIVLGFEEASRGHGGAGALYVRLRSKTRKAG